MKTRVMTAGRYWLGATGLAAGLTALLSGCQGMPTSGEGSANRDVQTVAAIYRPHDQKPDVSTLTTNSDLGDFLRFAMLNQPQVEAKYYDWLSSVENITVARSMPDPKFTFSAYIQDRLTSLMPGLMQDFPGPGKLKAAAQVATADSQGKYFAFETSVLQSAFDLKTSYYNLYFLDERIRINRQTLALLADLERAARAQNEVGKSTLQDVYRAQIEEDQLTTDIANLADSRQLLFARYKAALGLTHDQPDPPVPAQFYATTLDLKPDDVLATAFARNPQLKGMAADVRQAEAGIAQARKSQVPDFSAGLQAEVYTPPFYWPQASLTLPVWRDKIRAEIAAAQANQQAAAARLTAEQISLTVDLAENTYDYREETRNLALLHERLIPKARQSLEIARAGYLSGEVDFFNLIDAERTWLNFQLQDVQERTRREITLANLSLMIAGVAPANAPILTARHGNPMPTAAHSN